jgi:hypothetical protein
MHGGKFLQLIRTVDRLLERVEASTSEKTVLIPMYEAVRRLHVWKVFQDGLLHRQLRRRVRAGDENHRMALLYTDLCQEESAAGPSGPSCFCPT